MPIALVSMNIMISSFAHDSDSDISAEVANAKILPYIALYNLNDPQALEDVVP
jgi:hypothetical protein